MTASRFLEGLATAARRVEDARAHLDALGSGVEVTVEIYPGTARMVGVEVKPGPLLEALKCEALERLSQLERKYAELAANFPEVKP